MSYTDWLDQQWDVKVISKGKNKGRICFNTPVINYTLSKEDWECLKKKIQKV